MLMIGQIPRKREDFSLSANGGRLGGQVLQGIAQWHSRHRWLDAAHRLSDITAQHLASKLRPWLSTFACAAKEELDNNAVKFVPFDIFQKFGTACDTEQLRE
jgi:hypothetical protein